MELQRAGGSGSTAKPSVSARPSPPHLLAVRPLAARWHRPPTGVPHPPSTPRRRRVLTHTRTRCATHHRCTSSRLAGSCTLARFSTTRRCTGSRRWWWLSQRLPPLLEPPPPPPPLLLLLWRAPGPVYRLDCSGRRRDPCVRLPCASSRCASSHLSALAVGCDDNALRLWHLPKPEAAAAVALQLPGGRAPRPCSISHRSQHPLRHGASASPTLPMLAAVVGIPHRARLGRWPVAHGDAAAAASA